MSALNATVRGRLAVYWQSQSAKNKAAMNGSERQAEHSLRRPSSVVRTIRRRSVRGGLGSTLYAGDGRQSPRTQPELLSVDGAVAHWPKCTIYEPPITQILCRVSTDLTEQISRRFPGGILKKNPGHVCIVSARYVMYRMNYI